MGRKRKLGQFNASSQADIAFMLLIFFLVTTSMSTEQGLFRQLPPPSNDKDASDKINERNVFVVLINKDNQLAVEGNLEDINVLTEKTIEFLTNPSNKDDLSEQVKASKKMEEAIAANKGEEAAMYKKLVDECGDPNITKGVVSLQNDRGTKYETYIQVQNEIVAAFNICRDNFSKENFGGKKFDDLSANEQKLVKLVFPLSISEAEPKSVK